MVKDAEKDDRDKGVRATPSCRHNSPECVRTSRSGARLKVLMSIKPVYAEKILNGEKLFEFRKRPFLKSVERVVIYASSPVKKVIGEFELCGFLIDRKDRVWQKCKEHAGVTKTAFDTYYAKESRACALIIGEVVRYPKQFNLMQCFGVRPPQSYCYLDK